MKTLIYIAVGAILVYLFTKKSNLLNATASGELINVDYNTPYGKLFNRFYYPVSLIINKYNLSINENMALSVILKESYLDSMTKENKNVIGDDGKSIGFMQVSKPALTDVNNYFDLNKSMNDLYNEDDNLTVGCLYLHLCYKSALKSGSQNTVWLSFKKYNGGVGQTDTSKNSMATNYANKAYEYYNKFTGII